MMAVSSSTKHHHLSAPYQAGIHRLPIIRAHQEVAVDTRSHAKTSNGATRLAESLSHLLHLHIETPPKNNLHHHDWSFHAEDKHTTPTKSPKEDIWDKWHEVHGFSDWDNLLDPLHPWLRREIVKYGEFAQATYDAFDFDSFSEYCGSCRYNRHKLFDKLGLSHNGYKASKYIYAMSHIDMPQWLERSHLGDTWSKDSNWMGFVAVSDNEESQSDRTTRHRRRVAWDRGTFRVVRGLTEEIRANWA
ncbi:hypothetical protein L1049_009621 [Liquidambar formosana]|uniref:Uncharacterized protein n=1 Tax=Liquidambar formosana TaxID=63359 RepID=A0AAP0N8C3_LIQFO